LEIEEPIREQLAKVLLQDAEFLKSQYLTNYAILVLLVREDTEPFALEHWGKFERIKKRTSGSAEGDMYYLIGITNYWNVWDCDKFSGVWWRLTKFVDIFTLEPPMAYHSSFVGIVERICKV
jgi:hypothetical protein